MGTLDALIDGRFDRDTTIDELLAHGDLGLGTVQHLGGALIVLDGTLVSGAAAVDGGDELHVELPPGVGLGTPGVTDRRRIRLVEGGPGE